MRANSSFSLVLVFKSLWYSFFILNVADHRKWKSTEEDRCVYFVRQWGIIYILHKLPFWTWSVSVVLSSSVKESHAISFICWTLPLVLLYVKSIVGRQQSRSKMCFVSCLKPWGPEPHKLPILCPGLRKINPFVSDKHFVIKNMR